MNCRHFNRDFFLYFWLIPAGATKIFRCMSNRILIAQERKICATVLKCINSDIFNPPSFAIERKTCFYIIMFMTFYNGLAQYIQRTFIEGFCCFDWLNIPFLVIMNLLEFVNDLMLSNVNMIWFPLVIIHKRERPLSRSVSWNTIHMRNIRLLVISNTHWVLRSKGNWIENQIER